MVSSEPRVSVEEMIKMVEGVGEYFDGPVDKQWLWDVCQSLKPGFDLKVEEEAIQELVLRE